MREARRTALICIEQGSAILSLEDAKKHVRVDFEDDDDDIEAAVQSATAALDGADGRLRRALCTQTWQLVLPAFHRHHFDEHRERRFRHHRHEIELPLPPTISVSGINYVTPCGAAETLDPTLYRLINCGTDPSFLTPVVGNSWPSSRHQPDAVTITFVAGYGAIDKVPAPLISVAKLLVEDLYSNRGAQAKQLLEANPTLLALIRPYQVVRY